MPPSAVEAGSPDHDGSLDMDSLSMSHCSGQHDERHNNLDVFALKTPAEKSNPLDALSLSQPAPRRRRKS